MSGTRRNQVQPKAQEDTLAGGAETPQGTCYWEIT